MESHEPFSAWAGMLPGLILGKSDAGSLSQFMCVVAMLGPEDTSPPLSIQFLQSSPCLFCAIPRALESDIDV